MRDLAYDGNRWLYGGIEVGLAKRVFAFDTQQRRWDPTRDFVVPAKLTFGTIRALAYDPNGDSGRGSLWASDWFAPLVEFDRTGRVLRSIANPQVECFALAWDDGHRSLWSFGQGGSTYPADVRVVATEVDVGRGAATGSRVLGDLSFPATPRGGWCGGVELYVPATQPVFVICAQADTDRVYQLSARFHYGSSSGGTTAQSGGMPWPGNAAWTVRLDASQATVAVLAISSREIDLALPQPFFALTSRLLVDLGPVLVLPGVPVTSGSASIPLPVPQSPSLGGTTLFAQWFELSLIPPHRTSRAGAIFIHP